MIIPSVIETSPRGERSFDIFSLLLRERDGLRGLAATDLGPFRAIRRHALDALAMSDRDYGWTIEMQIKSARAGLRYAEVPVTYRRRVGRSKVSGTVRGVLGAARKILGLLAWYDLWERAPARGGSLANQARKTPRAQEVSP